VRQNVVDGRSIAKDIPQKEVLTGHTLENKNLVRVGGDIQRTLTAIKIKMRGLEISREQEASMSMKIEF